MAPPKSDLKTIVERLKEQAETQPQGVAMREKSFGLWNEITWSQLWDRVQEVAHALLSLGVEPGDRIAIHSENRPEWVIADMAIMAIRGATVGLYPTNPSAEVKYLLDDAGVKILIAEDQEQVDKALEVADQLPSLQRIVVMDPRGCGSYSDRRLMRFDDLLVAGRAHRDAEPHALELRMQESTPEDLAVLIYTSGTTGPPKGAMLTVSNINFAVRSGGSSGGLIDPPPGPKDVLLSYLPLSHVYERLLTCWLSIDAGSQIHFAESIDTVVSDLQQVQPTIFGSVPRILEKMHAAVHVRMANASRMKKWNFGVWSKAAAWMGNVRSERGGSHTLATRLVYAIGYPFLYRALKARLGMRRCRLAVSGAAPIAPEILRWFMGIGVPIVEAYGMTESSAIGTSNRLGRVHLGSVGEALPDVELKLAPGTGEILMRHEGVFAGYWGRFEATAETVDSEGWLHTGDVGEMDDGVLRIVDRIKDIIITAGGKNISPSEIENALKTSPFIKEAIVVGDGRKFLAALIGIELETVGAWAQSKKITYTTYSDLASKPEVIAMIGKVVADVNERFARVEQIKKYRLLRKELDHEQGELTATQKVKRSAVTQMLAGVVEEIYSDGSADAA